MVIAGLSGDSGKTLVSLGLLLAARRAGLEVRAFKKGPDYIDAAWLTWASGHPARNLDTWLMGFDGARDSFNRHAVAGLNVIEGNRGLYDGVDAQGTHSTAELAKALGAPVILVINATKVTRTAAAYVLGCQKLDPEVPIAGVVLNQVATKRHEEVLRKAIESACGVPVVGALPRAPADALLPSRHLGLVTPEEHPRIEEVRRNVLELVGSRLDPLLKNRGQATCFPVTQSDNQETRSLSPVFVGYLKDSAFTFYYPENLEALEAGGATLVAISSLAAGSLPDLDGLYIGGGFPETHGAALAGNVPFLGAVRAAAESGLPISAECGGLMLLSRAILWKGTSYPMAGVLPFRVEVLDRPQGHGYSRLAVDRVNPFFPEGTLLKGHEFHYSRIVPEGEPAPTACAVQRGAGCYQGRDGIVVGNVWASYTHLHALGAPEWAQGFLRAAQNFKLSRR